MTIIEEDLDKIQRPITKALLQSIGVNRHLSRDVAFEGLKYYGLYIITLLSYQGKQKVTLYMGSMRIPDNNHNVHDAVCKGAMTTFFVVPI